MIDGKRKLLTKPELAKELHKHLIIKDDGEIRYKAKEEFNYPKVKFEDDDAKSKKTKKSVKPTKKSGSTKPKIINKDDRFIIFDSEATDIQNINLTNVYELNDVSVYNDAEELVGDLGDDILISFDFMRENNAEQQFADYMERLKEKQELYDDLIYFTFNGENSRNIQVFIMRGDTLVGLVRTDLDFNLEIENVYVSKKFQGKGYVGEMMSLLFEYLNKIKLLKNINSVSLSYFSDSESGWIAYDKGISRYGFKNKELKYTNDQLKNINFVRKIHNDNYTKTMTWNKTTTGSGMLVKPVEAIEMRI
jgi:ribosomal protein S18 acetylase RimI-like enzyme